MNDKTVFAKGKNRLAKGAKFFLNTSSSEMNKVGSVLDPRMGFRVISGICNMVVGFVMMVIGIPLRIFGL